jgi:hypothetical protein
MKLKLMNMINDPRSIQEIHGPNGDWMISCGDIFEGHPDQIVSYLEDDGTIWFAILGEKGTVLQRINSKYVGEIIYDISS